MCVIFLIYYLVFFSQKTLKTAIFKKNFLKKKFVPPCEARLVYAKCHFLLKVHFLGQILAVFFFSLVLLYCTKIHSEYCF